MPKKGTKPKWEKEENRKIIFLDLLREPLSFTELLEKTQLSRGTLAYHIRELEKERIIERVRKNGKRVYQTVLDEEKITDELKSVHFDVLLELVSENLGSTFVELWKAYLTSLTKVIIYFKKRQLEGKPSLSPQEVVNQTITIIESTTPPEILELLQRK